MAQQRAASATVARDSLLDRVREHDAMREPDAVEAYLERYPHLVPILLEAVDIVPRSFGDDAPLALEMDIDPEGYDDVGELFVLITSRFDVKETLARSTRFEDDWWLAASPDSPAVLVFDFEFQSRCGRGRGI